MKKIAYALIGSIFTLILSFSLVSFANHGSSSVSGEKTIQGKITALNLSSFEITVNTDDGDQVFKAASKAWVIKDNKKSEFKNLAVQDRVTLILNASNEAATIKAESDKAAVAGNTEISTTAKSSTNAVQPTVAVPRVETAPTVPVLPEIPPVTASAAVVAKSNNQLQNFKLSIHSKDFKLEMKLEGNEAKVEWKSKKKKVHLKGPQAQQFILTFLKEVQINPAESTQQEAARIAKILNLDGTKIRTEVKWGDENKDDDDAYKQDKANDQDNEDSDD